jgi:DNA-binding NarL/FixJ family response regulator
MTMSLLIFLALGLLAALGLFLNLKMEVEKRSRRERANVDAMLARLVEAESRMAPAPLTLVEHPFIVPRPGLNLSRKVQVARLLREGMDSSQIAAELGMSRREVQVLAGVQAMVAHAAGAE